jgi:hypothetical protein
MASWSVQRSDGVLGRFIESCRSIDAGEVILSQLAYAAVLYGEVAPRCENNHNLLFCSNHDHNLLFCSIEAVTAYDGLHVFCSIRNSSPSIQTVFPV